MTYLDLTVYFKEKINIYDIEKTGLLPELDGRIVYGRSNKDPILGKKVLLEEISKDIEVKIDGKTSVVKSFEAETKKPTKFPVYIYDEDGKAYYVASNKEELNHILDLKNVKDINDLTWDNGKLFNIYENKSVSVGDAVAVGDKMYIKTENGMKPWNMTKEVFDKLFPLVERFSIEQNNGTCWLDSVFSYIMRDPKSRISLYERFSVDSNGNVYVTLPNGTSVKFENAEILPYVKDSNSYIKNTLGAFAGIDCECKGLQMLSETYALYLKGEGDFAIDLSGKVDLSVLYGGHEYKAMKDIFGISCGTKKVDNAADFINFISNQNNDIDIVSIALRSNTISNDGGHAVSYVKYDKENNSVIVYNTQNAAGISLNIDDLFKTCKVEFTYKNRLSL